MPFSSLPFSITKEKLTDFCRKVDSLKAFLKHAGYTLYGNEPLKITLCAKGYGYHGTELASLLEKENIICEFADRDFIVFMLTPETGDNGLSALKNALISIPKREIIKDKLPVFALPQKVMSINDAVFSPSETILASQSEGKILASANVSCPPAVPIVVSGEKIDKASIKCFEYYGTEYVTVIKER